MVNATARSACCLSLAILTLPVAAEIRGYHFTNPAVIVAIDPAAGTDSVPSELANCNAVSPTPINTLFASSGFVSGFAQRDDKLYALEWQGNDIYLIEVDVLPICASAVRVGSEPTGFANLEGLAWSAAEQVFYSVDFSFADHTGQLVRIDPSTGLAQAVGATHMTFDVRVTGLVLDGSTLYGITSGFGARDSELLTIDHNTGIETSIGFTGLAANSLESLVVDDTQSELRLLAAGTTLHEINSSTGQASGVGGSYASTVYALASAGRAQAATTTLVAAVLPSGRSVQVGATATAFVTMLNAGNNAGEDCGIALANLQNAGFSYQTTDPSSNALIGIPNTPVNIGVGSLQTYVVSITPNAVFAPMDVAFDFACGNAVATDVINGVNTLLLSAATNPVADLVALAATAVNPGIVNIPGVTGTGAFAVASVNVGTSADITVTADTSATSLPLSISLCQTDPLSGACLAPPAAAVTLNVASNATPTFSIFPAAGGAIGFDPASNRVFVRFTDASGVVRGATSVAVRTN